MAHFGALSLPTASHQKLFSTLGSELVRRGHKVTLFNLPNCLPTARKNNFGFVSIASESETASIMESFARSSHGSTTGTLKGQIEFDRIFYKTLLTRAPDAIRSASLDALICDQAVICGSTVAELTRLPFATLCGGLALNREKYIPPFFTNWPYRRTWDGALRNRLGYAVSGLVAAPISRDLNRFRLSCGLKKLRSMDDSFSPIAQISQQVPDADFPRESLPSTFHYVGLIAPPKPPQVAFPFERLTGQPLIYCTLGTTVNRRPELLKLIAEACRTLPYQLVISLGGGLKVSDIPPLPGSPLVVVYAPQMEVLKRTSLMITHAGISTSLESLSCGVPIVAIPILFEQPAIAARIAHSGAGECVSLSGLTPARLRAKISKVMTTPSYRESARRVQASLAQTNGRKTAADIVESILPSHSPALTDKVEVSNFT